MKERKKQKKTQENAVKMAQKSIDCSEIKENHQPTTHSTFIGYQKPFSVHREKKNFSKKSVNEKWKYILRIAKEKGK